jgi:hypothetical protein
MGNEITKGGVLPANRFVAFIDILGFKEMLLSKGHDFVIEKLEELRHIKRTLIDGSNEEFKLDTLLQSVLFSDTILIFSSSDTLEDLMQLLHQLRVLIGIYVGSQIPIKGVISYGKVTVNMEKSFFVGQPIIDAYLLQEDIQMIGVVLDHNAENRMNQLISVNSQHKAALATEICKYKIPTKHGRINHVCVNWPHILSYTKLEATNWMLMMEDRNKVERLYSTASGRHRLYIDNTIEFIDSLIVDAKEKYKGIRTFRGPKKNQ